MEENAGTRFGNYQLIKRIDVGGMGEVYLAHQLTAFGRRVAIKIIRPDLVHDITARARFLREAEVSAHLKHEHILPMFDFGEVEGRLFLATPYIEGGTLAKHLRERGAIPLPEVRTLFVPLVQAIAYIHRRGVIHRDLKPTNIMLDSEDGEVYVRLIDFGIASLQGQNASPPLTMAGHEMGTVAYMAPERLSGIAAPSNDIFSLGVILHQMLTARMPVTTPSPHTSIPRLPEPLAQVIRHSTTTDPAERYATAEELLKAFEQAYQEMIQQAPAKNIVSAPMTVQLTHEQMRPAPAPRPERVALAHVGEISELHSVPVAAPVPLSSHFTPEDYSAPTTAFQALPQFHAPASHHVSASVPLLQRSTATKKKSPWLLVISTTSILILLLISGVLYDGYKTVAEANVSVDFMPRSSVISQVFTLKADPTVQSVNAAQATLPAHVLPISQSMQQTAATTGQADCLFPGFGCQQAVSPDDVSTLEAQIQPGLEQSIRQALQSKMSTLHGMQVGSVQFSVPTIIANPQVGSISNTVTVTLSEQGNAGYILNTDVTDLVHQLLTTAVVSQLGQGFQVIDGTATSGQTALQTINPRNGVSTLKVAAGVAARYQFTSAQLQALSTSLAGKSQAQAEALLKSQLGIDPTSISIHFSTGSSGQNMPDDSQHIKLIPLNPTNLPDVVLTPFARVTQAPAPNPPPAPPTRSSRPVYTRSLTSTPTPSPTPTPSSTATPAPDLTPTATDDGSGNDGGNGNNDGSADN
ncbi:MAG: serine/threonine protein kinase [Ktedonobacteraceae bacterium]